jgi:hypothetical protein
MMHKLNGIIEVIKLILIPFVILNFILYLCGAFIAWDTDPMNWLLVKTIFGRICLVVIELMILVNTPKFWGIMD